jgi:hypothetical protein
VAWLIDDLVGAKDTNPNGPNAFALPVPAALTLWGQAPTPAVAAQSATLTGNPDTDHPAYPAIPAAATPPVREQAAPSMNALILGIFGNFIDAVYGPSVPASNFSLAMGAGDPDAAAGPLLTSLVISTEVPTE